MTETSEPTGLAHRAKGALEQVCSGAGMAPADRFYSPTFVHHVNDVEFRGLDGAERSVALYKKPRSDLAITVEASLRTRAPRSVRVDDGTTNRDLPNARRLFNCSVF